MADVYVQPIEPIDSPFIENELITINGVENLFKISFIIVIIMNVILVIGLICLLIAKLNKSEELLNKSKKICENLLYYILLVFGLANISIAFVESIVVGILSLIIVVASFILRLKMEKKKISYFILLIYLVIMLCLWLVKYNWLLVYFFEKFIAG